MGDIAGEPPQDRLGRGGSQPDRRRILDHRIELLADQIPSDRTGQRRLQQRVRLTGAFVGQVQLHVVDLLESGDEVEPEQPGDAEPDERGPV